MLWGERTRRRRAVIVLIVLMALVDAAFALAVLASDDRSARPVAAAPVHPAATEFVPDGTQISACTDQNCFRQAFGNVAFRDGPKAAIALLVRIYGEGGSAECHSLAHAVGAASLTRNDGDVARTFAEGSSVCWSGYYHGILERALLDVGASRPEALQDASRTICSSALERLTPWIAYQCLHGLGHGVMITTGLDLPRSLDVCKSLATRWERDACKSGVFMENISPSFAASQWVRDDDLLYPCTAVAPEDRARCFQMVTTRALPFLGNDWSRAAELCASVAPKWSEMCFRSLGRDASNHSGRDVDATLETCALARPYGGEAACVLAAAQDVTANFTSGLHARPLCAAVPAALTELCFEGVGSVMGRFRKTEAARVADCRAVTSHSRLVAACLRGGRTTLPRA